MPAGGPAPGVFIRLRVCYAVPVVALAFGLLLAFAALGPAHAANCSQTSTDLVAIPDLGTKAYKGEQGGLYPGGSNQAPRAYQQAGLKAARSVQPRDVGGHPDPNGKIVLLSIGMSNAAQEFAAFMTLEQGGSGRDGHVVLVNGAQGGQDARMWINASARTWSAVEERLLQAGVSDAQVAAVWLKQADAAPRSDFSTYARTLQRELSSAIRLAAGRYPNLQQVFVSPRTYAGYATTRLNPEPYAYETGFADKFLVAESVANPTSRPWIGWGPYLWTNGVKGRRDGFVWNCEDVQPSDGTHPSDRGRMKVAGLLQTFFQQSPDTPWYRTATPAPPRTKGSWWLAGGAAGLTAALLIGAGVLLWWRRKRRPVAGLPQPPSASP